MATKPLPQQPFLTEDFSADGGGIDFLGLQLINFRILAQDLLPKVNNATSDIGIFCLGVWIPWKFKQVCARDPRKFTQENYDRFRQAIEVVMADGVRDGSAANAKFGQQNRRIGVGQQIHFPCRLEFEKDTNKRTEVTSIYAAPLYGPALRYLDFVGLATAQDGRPTWIHIPSESKDITQICEYIDSQFGSHPLIKRFEDFDFTANTHEELVNLQMQGLHPSAFRVVPEEVERALAGRILGTSTSSAPNERLITTRLILQTLEHVGSATSEQLREMWYTGLTDEGEPLTFGVPGLEKQRILWAIFEGRQFQRYILETFLKVFEKGVRQECSSIDEVVDATLLLLGGKYETLASAVLFEASQAGTPTDEDNPSQWWNQHISGASAAFERNPAEGDDISAVEGMTMLARWILRTKEWLIRYGDQQELAWGGESRISMRWFHEWLEVRMEWPLREFLKDLFANLIFTQHLRVALSRLDSNAPKQRLRFMLGDFGIAPTSGMEKYLGEGDAPWMADRLDAWLLLLKDVGIVDRDPGTKKFTRGKNAAWV